MEDVLDVSAEPDDARYPVVTFDERPCELRDEVREPHPCQPGQPRCYDAEYQRNGMGNLFMFFQPLAGWRHAKVTEQRQKEALAQCRQDLVDLHFPDAQKIRVVLATLNPHAFAALYTAFPPEEARCIARKLEVHFTPNPGAWLIRVELELSVLVRQCLQRRIPDIPPLQAEVAAWQNQRTALKTTVPWRFGISQARTKLSRLYPQ